jgi:uncharacterized protein (TIGR02421 family)
LVVNDTALKAVDKTIADCNHEIRLFYHVAPTNEREEKARFRNDRKRNGEPAFRYRPLEFDPRAMRRTLREAPIDNIDDEVLGRICADKIWELERLVGLLEARGNAHFLESSVEVFGRPPAHLVREARDILAMTRYAERRDLAAEEVCGLLEAHLDGYRRRYADFDCQVVLEEAMSAKMYVYENRIHVKKGAMFSRDAALSDTVHEIDAHVLSFLNGRHQPLRLFEIGPRGTLAYQESLGVFTEIANGTMFAGRRASLAARVVAVAAMTDGAGFTEIYPELTEAFDFDADEAFLICVRVFRGDGFTKDWLYVAELERIFRHWATGGDMESLVVAKVTMDVLEDIQDLVDRGVLNRARYLPGYFDRLAAYHLADSIQPMAEQPKIPLADLLSLDLG